MKQLDLKNNWNAVFKTKKWGEYPAEDLVRFIKKEKNFSKKKQLKILEIGCGLGGNLWFFGKEKILFDAIDVSSTAINAVKQLFVTKYKNLNKFKNKIINCDALNIPKTLDNYDIIVDSECLCYSSEVNFKKILKKIHEKLNINGCFWSRIFSIKTSGCRTGKNISKNFWIPDRGPLKGYGPTRTLKLNDVKKIYGNIWKSIKVSELIRKQDRLTIHELIIEARK